MKAWSLARLLTWLRMNVGLGSVSQEQVSRGCLTNACGKTSQYVLHRKDPSSTDACFTLQKFGTFRLAVSRSYSHLSCVWVGVHTNDGRKDASSEVGEG